MSINNQPKSVEKRPFDKAEISKKQLREICLEQIRIVVEKISPSPEDAWSCSIILGENTTKAAKKASEEN